MIKDMSDEPSGIAERLKEAFNPFFWLIVWYMFFTIPVALIRMTIMLFKSEK